MNNGSWTALEHIEKRPGRPGPGAILFTTKPRGVRSNPIPAKRNRMVVGEISMTPGMMANLFRIRSTVDLLERTRTGLSTGLMVNTPLDDPVSFFAARAHWNRADDITNYKTAMAEAIQTIKAADAGIDGVTALLQAARGVAESALQADKNAMEIDLRNASAGDVIEIGGTAFSLAACDSVTGARVPVGASDLETARNLADAVNNTAEKDLDVTA
ncbi:MAG: hypothetical protein GY859_27750, partial [Desulfobacterales bacterium]|nr:hypothetical protein [Desulfobacterales bacterium]